VIVGIFKVLFIAIFVVVFGALVAAPFMLGRKAYDDEPDNDGRCGGGMVDDT
jgi:hypothetical protein